MKLLYGYGWRVIFSANRSAPDSGADTKVPHAFPND